MVDKIDWRPDYEERHDFKMYRSFDWVFNNKKVLRLKYEEELYPKSIEEILLRMFVFKEGSVSKTGKPRVEDNKMRTKEDFLLTVKYYYPDLTKEQLMGIVEHVTNYVSIRGSGLFSDQYCPNVRKYTHYPAYQVQKEEWYTKYFPTWYSNYCFLDIGNGEFENVLEGLLKRFPSIEI